MYIFPFIRITTRSAVQRIQGPQQTPGVVLAFQVNTLYRLCRKPKPLEVNPLPPSPLHDLKHESGRVLSFRVGEVSTRLMRMRYFFMTPEGLCSERVWQVTFLRQQPHL